jgi:competence protein ComEA
VNQQLLRPPPKRDWRARLDDLRAVVPLGPAGLALAACAIVAAIALAVLGYRLLRTPPPAELSLPRAPTATAPPSTAPAGPVVVHVAGAVVRPGVYRVDGAARVDDAVAAAGGVTAEADLDTVNLAAKVADGDRVFVPRKGQAPPPVAEPAGPTEGSEPPSGPVNLNTASAEELEKLPGVGPATAQAIITWRREHGGFRSVQDLLEVRGIGPAKLDSLRDQVTV